MINKNLLLSRMVAIGENQDTMAKKLGVSRTTFNRCINGKGCFDLAQAKALCDILGISDSTERVKIFFAEPS